MTPSPSPTPPSSHSSHPTSSSISSEGTPRPSLVSRALPPISQVSPQLDLTPRSLPMGASGPNVPVVFGESSELSRHGKDKSTGSEPASSEAAHPAQETWPEAPEQEPEASTSSLSITDPPRHQSKKKRTRTLTTPHQSAVLHALLAQSRFPTTAMREEVGRSIGLSARKVQVWFQNQRQKARKPRQQGSTPTDSQPQYGAFTSGSSTDAGSEPGPSGVSGTFQGIDPMGRQSPYVSEPSSSSARPRGSPAPNLGISLHLPYRYPEFSEYSQARAPAQEHHLHGSVSYGVQSPPPTRRGEGSFTPPSTFFPIPSPHYPFHPPLDNPPDLYPRPPLPQPPLMRSSSPIVLPPLRFDQPHTGQFQGNLPPPPLPELNLRNMPPSASFPGLSPSEVSSSSSSILPSPYSITTQPPSRHGETIPPPFTLQPEPQWDPPHPGPRPMLTLHPPVGPVQSVPFSQATYSRHRTYSDPTRTLPPLSGHGLEQRPPSSLQPWPLSILRPDPSGAGTSMSAGGSTSMRRFDPVRSAVSQGQREEEVGVEDRSSSTRYAQGSGQSYYHHQQDTGGDVARRNRHTYDFGRPSERMSMLTPPRRSGEPEQEEEEARQGTADASRGGGSYTLPPPLPPPPPR